MSLSSYSEVPIKEWMYDCLDISTIQKVHVDPFDNSRYKIVDNDEQRPISNVTSSDGNVFL